jgi:hypothetical protein
MDAAAPTANRGIHADVRRILRGVGHTAIPRRLRQSACASLTASRTYPPATASALRSAQVPDSRPGRISQPRRADPTTAHVVGCAAAVDDGAAPEAHLLVAGPPTPARTRGTRAARRGGAVSARRRLSSNETIVMAELRALISRAVIRR